MLTLNQIVSQITNLATAHEQIAESGVGDFAEWQAKERSYPILWVFHESTAVSQMEIAFSIRLICADRVIVGEEGDDTQGHEQEVISDTLLVLLDFLAYFQQNHSQPYDVVTSATIDPFTERLNDRLAGNSVTIQIRQPFDWNKCQIPQTGASIPPTVDGLTLYNFCDPAVIARLTPTQVACLEAEYGVTCADGTVNITNTDSDPIATVTVASGGVEPYVIPNVSWTQSDGSPQSTAYGDAIVCDMAAGGSLSVAVSDNSPDVGDTITITATPTGFTPNNYLFFALKSGILTYIGEQVGNAINWDVSILGAFTVFVQADDGTIGSFNVGGEAVTSTGLLLDLYSASFAYSVRRIRSSATLSMRVRRAIDNTEQDFGFIDNLLDHYAIATFCGASDGFVATWYDQSGNGNNANNAVLSGQPKIYDGSTGIITENGRPSITFNGTSNKLNMAIAVASTASQASFGVFSRNSGASSALLNGSNMSALHIRGTSTFFRNSNTLGVSFAANPTGQQLMENVYHSNSLTTYINGASTVQAYVFGTPGSYNAIGNQSSLWHNGGMQEVIHFNQDMTADQAAINININTFYNVY